MRRRLSLTFPIAIAALAMVLFFTRTLWLAGLGWALVYDQGPAKADIAVVLAGDYSGHRIVKGAELVRQGYVPAVLVSGPPGFYGFHECDAAIQFAIRSGYPANWFVPLPVKALSTREEAVEVLAELHRRNVHNFLLVTSNFHTARAGRIYRSLERRMARSGGPAADPPDFRTVAAPDQFFHPDSWWHSRQASKILFTEWTKTLANAFGI